MAELAQKQEVRQVIAALAARNIFPKAVYISAQEEARLMEEEKRQASLKRTGTIMLLSSLGLLGIGLVFAFKD